MKNASERKKEYLYLNTKQKGPKLWAVSPAVWEIQGINQIKIINHQLWSVRYPTVLRNQICSEKKKRIFKIIFLFLFFIFYFLFIYLFFFFFFFNYYYYYYYYYYYHHHHHHHHHHDNNPFYQSSLYSEKLHKIFIFQMVPNDSPSSLQKERQYFSFVQKDNNK